MKKLTFLGALAFVLLTGCATRYQNFSFSGGFVEKQLSRNEFTVLFGGNGYTTGQRAIDLCMLRCAEITLGHGFHYFILTANNAGYDTSTAVTVGNSISTGYGGGVFVATTQVIPKPSASNRILCFRKKPTATAEYFDAQNVFNELSQKYSVHKDVQKFPGFEPPIATVGLNLEVIPRTYPIRTVNIGEPAGEKSRLKIQSFAEGCLAQEAGLKKGDEICGLDGVSISDLGKYNEQMAKWEIGQIVQVSTRRGGKEIIVPVKTVFNPAFRFKQTKEIKCSEPVSEKDVIVIEGSRPTVVVFPVAEYADWENPLASSQDMKRYLIAAAANYGVNGVLVLNSQEEVKNLDPNADMRIGFLCSLLIVPKSRLGVVFETGTGYENRRVVRRVLNQEAGASGLHIGDNVLAVNGIDLVLNASEAMKNCMKWSVGQEVQVTVARDGKELTFLEKTVENRP